MHADPHTPHHMVVLQSLKEYLDHGPQGGNARLEAIAVELKGDRLSANSKMLELLGTAVGRQHAFQGPFRDSGLLQVVLQNLGSRESSAAVIKQYLRIVGNCIADNDTNREIVVGDLDIIVSCLEHDDLTTTALAVLFNLFNGFEPAHVRAAELRIDEVVASCIVQQRVPEEAMDYATDLLHSTTDKLTPDQLIDSISLRVFDNILRACLPYDEDRGPEYLGILVHYMQDPHFQQQISTPKTLEPLLDLLLEFSTHLSADENLTVFRELATQIDPNKVTSDETNVILMVRLASSIAAISATDAFIQNVTLETPLVETIVSILRSPLHFPTTVCACVMLGNLATSDPACIAMVEDMALHKPLLEILSRSKETALLYAAAGFTRHLTFPLPNRKTLGEAGLLTTCCRLLSLSDPSVRGEAAAILVKLLTNNPQNTAKVIHEPLSADLALPGTSSDGGAPTARTPTMLSYIVAQALAPSIPLPSTTMKNPSIELPRALIAILRYLRQQNLPPSSPDVETFFTTPSIALPIARLVRQRFYADARSEGLLGLGLMAQTPEGARCVVQELRADAGLLDAIKEFAGEQKEGKGSDEKAGRDYQNAVVLLSGLVGNGGEAMDEEMRSGVQDLQAELSKLMI